MNDRRPGCLTVLFRPKPRSRQSTPAPRPTTQDILPFRVKEQFLSPAELAFYRVLVSVLGAKAIVFPKVRLSDIFFVLRPDQNISYFNRISQRHVDFLVCDPVTVQPYVAVELDDSSHKLEGRREKDLFLEQVFLNGQLPLVRIPVQYSYKQVEIADKLIKYVVQGERNQVDEHPEFDQPAMASDETPVDGEDPPLCPLCYEPMVLRRVKRGENQGRLFYGCRRFPSCRGMLPVEPELNSKHPD